MLQAATIFQSGMILQREKPVAVWGAAVPGAQIQAEIQEKRAAATADESGAWKLTLPALTASENEILKIEAKMDAGADAQPGENSQTETCIFTDVAVGEVWLAGGQSNMEFHMRYEKHKQQALETCENPRVRFFDVPEVCYDGQLEDFDYSRMGIWRKATKEDLDYFSAVGYYFQKELERVLDVPVGIVGCNWGGTTASAWMNPQTIEQAGPAWLRYFEKRCEGRDMQEYWEGQHTNPMNDTGNPFANAFSELLMARTLSEEELMQFFSNIPGNYEEMMANMLDPKTVPGCLYEHMLKTIAPYSVRGILWYQGESDDDVPGMNVLYKDMLTGLIGDWRALWQEKLPFLFVQLPGFLTWLPNTPQNHYPVIRKCQEEVANTVEGAYLCSISDVGEEKDIHPKNKKAVGERLSLLARHYVYGEDILCDAPVAKEIVRDGSQITITFANAGQGLHITGETVSALQVTEQEEKNALETEEKELEFTAEVCGNKLVIRLAQETDKPVKVAFARTSWYLVNLYNEADIPAIPFEFVC